ncbi:MAG TPA: BTAD domain-containing putative transcriptional regulator [Candidatus Sulfomarinibacteraceae bacterium]|nr:BTAD domain-containing putative transcriptional regulator [Candidatus Sulfomarinibacteraceae bacterium]
MTTRDADQAPLQIYCLGRLEIHYQGRRLSPSLLKKAQALLVYLALEPGPHRRDKLATLLWSDMPAATARANLRTALSRLRRPLEPYVHASRSHVALRPDPGVWVDAARLEQGLAAEGIAVQRQALALYRGEFLESLSLDSARRFEEWALLRGERLRALVLDAFAGVAQQALDAGDQAQAIGDLRRLLALDPWREAAHRALMRALAASGERAAALAQYERCRRTLRAELGVGPAPATTALYEAIKEGAHAPPAPPSPTVARHNNLPPQTTPFAGRREELAQLAALLADPHCRLLTLLGPGGSGKTRLALEAARRAKDTFAAGVALVPLDRVDNAARLAAAIVESLALPPSGDEDPQARLLAYLRRRELLLVLDDLAPLPDGGELLVQLLEGAPRLKLLVTARQRLNLYQEWLLDVAGPPS